MAEAALVLPVYFFMILGMVFGGLSVYRYQQVAEVAREGARWASVRGADNARPVDKGGTGKPIATVSDVYNKGMKHAAVSFDKSNVAISGSGCTSDPFQFTVTWSDANQKKGTTVTVMVKYKLLSGVYVSSTSTMVIAY
jgi:Flp pilus assembly protein TadG